MSLLKNNDWFDIVLEGTKINENDDITESRNKLKKGMEGSFTKESSGGEEMSETTKPTKCIKCGSTEIGVFIEGEPIYKCKECGKYLGTVPFPTKESTDDEIVEEGFNHNRKKFDRSIRKTRKKTNGYYGTMSEKDVVKCGYDPIPKALINKLNSDAKWIRSEFIKEYNKIKDNNIIDTDDNLKLSDIVKIENGDTTVSYTTYLQNRVSGFVYTSISVAVMAPNENSNNDLDYQICDKYIRKVTSIFKDIKDTIEDKYYNKNNGKDTFDIEIDSTSDNPDYVDDDYGDACVARFSLCFEMTLRRHVNESVYDEIDEFDTFVEGANLDIIKELHKAKKEDKKSLKKISKAINEGKYKDARKYFNDYEESAEKSINYIRSIDMNNTEKGISDVMYGIVLFLNTSLNIGCTALLSMIKPLHGKGTIFGSAYTITKFINNVLKTNKEYKKLKENNTNVGAYQAYISNKLKELETNIRYIDRVIDEYDGTEGIYDKYKEESVEDIMNENITNDEIFEEGVKDFFKKIRSKIRMKKTQEGQQIKQSDLSKYGFKDISSEIENKIKSDFTWITSEFSKYFDKIKNNPISDKYKDIKYKDVTILFNNFNTNERVYYKLNNSIELLIDIPVFNIDITDNVEIENTNEVLIHVYNEINKIVSNIEKEYNKKTDENKLKFMRISSTDTGESEYYIYLGLRFNMSLEKIYKESVADNFNDLELDYIFGNITESEYNRIKEENAIGQMLPQVPLNGETLSKTPDVESDVENLDNFINDADGVLKGEVDEFVKEYVTDKDCTFDVYLEASISKLVNRVVNKVKIPNKHARIIVNKAILKAKCKMLGNQTIDEKDIKVIDAKKRLINEEQEYRKIMKSLDNETKKQVEEVSKKIEKEVEDDLDIDDIVTNDKLTNKSNKNTEGKKLSTKDDDNYIKNIDSELKHLETVRPVKNPDEENKDYTRRLKKWEDKKYNLEMKKAKLQANFMREYVDNNPTELYSSDPEYRLIIEKQELEHYLETAQKNNNIDSIRKYENKLKLNRLQIAKESVETTEVVLLEAVAIEDEIKPIIDILNSKGYHTKYSSPGHHHLRRKEDADHNGVYNGKLYSDARLMFDDDYKSIPEAPKYWYTRQVDNCVYLDVKPITYNPNDGTPDEAFGLWKDKYMSSLAEWAKEIRTKPGPKEGKQKEEVKEESVYDIDNNLNEIMESVLGDLELDLALDI